MSSSSEMRWYYVAADYKSTHPGHERHRHLWERSVFVFQATVELAEQVAIEIAKKHEHEYLNVYGELVRWVFVRIESWSELFDTTIGQGTEVYWDWNFSHDQPKTFWRVRPSRNWTGKHRRKRRPVLEKAK